MYTRIFLLASCYCLAMAGAFAQNNWQDLFNGRDFESFQQLNGEAEYRVENGEMVGVSELNTPNSFLATK